MNPIDIALRIATPAHAGQLDRDGYPVILHPLTVGLMGHADEEKMTGFLHDVVEDTSYSFEDLLHEGIPTGVVNALRILTHQPGTAEHVTELLRSKGDEVNTLLLPEETFYIGEAYHQHYYEKTDGEPYCHLRTKKF